MRVPSQKPFPKDEKEREKQKKKKDKKKKIQITPPQNYENEKATHHHMLTTLQAPPLNSLQVQSTRQKYMILANKIPIS